jgi:hypothetical protein
MSVKDTKQKERIQDIKDTVECDASYREHVKKKREKRAEEGNLNLPEKFKIDFDDYIKDIDKDINQIDDYIARFGKHVEEYKQKPMKEIEKEVETTEDSELSKNREGRVRCVSKTSGNYHEVTVETQSGDRFTQKLEIGLPEDKNEWERLCEYVGVGPKPSDLRGEKVPVSVPKEKDEPWLNIQIPRITRPNSLHPEAYREYKKKPYKLGNPKYSMNNSYGPTIGGLNERKIDIPPIQRGLKSSVFFSLKRTLGQRIRHSELFTSIIEYPFLLFPWVAPFLILAFSFTTMYLPSLLIGSKAATMVVTLITVLINMPLIVYGILYFQQAYLVFPAKFISYCTDNYNSDKES